MDNTGFEHTTFPPGKLAIAVIGGAESGAQKPVSAAPDTALAFVSRRWPALTAEQRLAILEIVATSAAPEPERGSLRLASC